MIKPTQELRNGEGELYVQLDGSIQKRTKTNPNLDELARGNKREKHQ